MERTVVDRKCSRREGREQGGDQKRVVGCRDVFQLISWAPGNQGKDVVAGGAEMWLVTGTVEANVAAMTRRLLAKARLGWAIGLIRFGRRGDAGLFSCPTKNQPGARILNHQRIRRPRHPRLRNREQFRLKPFAFTLKTDFSKRPYTNTAKMLLNEDPGTVRHQRVDAPKKHC